MKSNNYLKFGILFLILITISACAPEGRSSEEFGFFGGIIHGICLPFAIIGKLFGAEIGIYAERNTGLLYWIGFILGLAVLGGGGSRR